ncbi:MAG: enoyl-CoA hydratase/isomerase family protein [Hyphomicrobiales bacterium]|nr:enoyl-CoA hydratase/isomerase family protein [Hyphomicrobiales bacterium]
MSEGRIETAVEGPIGWITFDNQKRRNAMSLAMWKGVTDALARFSADPTVRAVVLRGAGEAAFVSGADISEFEANRNNAQAQANYAAATDGAWRALEKFDKPLIAMIRGFCFGGGLAIAMKADVRIATEGSLYSIPAAKLGIAYPPHSVRDLVSLVGPANAKDILFTGRRMSADEAFRLGLVHRVVPDAHLQAEVVSYCATLGANAPLSMRASKEVIDQIARDEPDAARVKELVRACFDSQDYAEGRRAFLEKRRPAFSGR